MKHEWFLQGEDNIKPLTGKEYKNFWKKICLLIHNIQNEKYQYLAGEGCVQVLGGEPHEGQVVLRNRI